MGTLEPHQNSPQKTYLINRDLSMFGAVDKRYACIKIVYKNPRLECACALEPSPTTYVCMKYLPLRVRTTPGILESRWLVRRVYASSTVILPACTRTRRRRSSVRATSVSSSSPPSLFSPSRLAHTASGSSSGVATSRTIRLSRGLHSDQSRLVLSV